MKKWLAVLLMAAMVVAGAFSGNMEAKASGTEEEVSYVNLENTLIGYAEMQTWGVYLMDGYSTLNDAGNSRVGVGGITNAAKRCTVSVNTVLERKVNGSWSRVTSFTETNENAIHASISQYVSVVSGYYYRVRSMHRASTDSSASYTDALWM